MIKLMNSAMMPQPGIYELIPLTQAQFVGILRDSGKTDSYVGYPQTAEFVERISGVPVAVSRRQVSLMNGERILVVRLSYRPQDANSKGQPVDESDYEFFMVKFLER